MLRTGIALLVAMIVGLGGLATVTAAGEKATGSLVSSTGASVGTVTLEQGVDGVTILVSARGLPAGVHGIHLHAVGTCTGPDFASAGGHFNPTTKKHGLKNPEGPHAGDIPNLTVAADGSVNFRGFNNLVTLSPGSASLFDADGAALVIHAGPDDDVTDPAGNSGARIACAVLMMTQTAPGMPRTGAGGLTPGGEWLPLIGAALLAANAVSIARRRRTS